MKKKPSEHAQIIFDYLAKEECSIAETTSIIMLVTDKIEKFSNKQVLKNSECEPEPNELFKID